LPGSPSLFPGAALTGNKKPFESFWIQGSTQLVFLLFANPTTGCTEGGFLQMSGFSNLPNRPQLSPLHKYSVPSEGKSRRSDYGNKRKTDNDPSFHLHASLSPQIRKDRN